MAASSMGWLRDDALVMVEAAEAKYKTLIQTV